MKKLHAMLAGVEFGTATGPAISAPVNGGDVRVIFALAESTPST